MMVEQEKTEEGMNMAVTPLLQPPPQVAAAAASLHYNPYPAPLARYEDVFTKPKLFMETLEKLHTSMGTKFMIPIIGGKDLDLHKLFVEVTTRGGIEKILREKKWKEVTAAFQFPSTATNASFVLRKYYFSLIHHYEQIYYFRALGWTPMPHASLQSGHAVPIAVHGGYRAPPPTTTTTTTTLQLQPPSVISDPVQQDPPASSVGTQVIGVIDGKFESGYLVTVTIGSQKLKGVLYQTAAQSVEPQQPGNVVTSPAVLSVTPALVKRRRRRRKKSEIRRRDPAHPKPNRSGYNFFFAEQHARLKPLYRGRDREISRIIGELWTSLHENEKIVYQDQATNDKERYKREMEGYRERLRTGQLISNAVPIQQRIPMADADMPEPEPKDETGRDSSEIFDDDEEDDDDIDDVEDAYCSLSGSESEELNDVADKAVMSEGVGPTVEPCSVDVGLSLGSGSVQTEQTRAQGHCSNPVLDDQQKKISAE